MSDAPASPRGFFAGLRYAFRGMRFVYVEHPGLARFYAWPIVVVLALVALDVMFAFEHGGAWVEHLAATPTGDSWGASALRFAHHLAEILVSLTLSAVGLVLVGLIAPVVAAPFNDALSAEVERLETGAEGARFGLGRAAAEVGRTVRVEATKVLLYVSVMGPLFVASFVLPGVGQVLYSIVGALFTLAYFAIDYVDWPASRRALGVRERARILTRHPRPMLGFGLGVAVLLFVPIVQVFFMPAAVAGGTLLFLALRPTEVGGSAGTTTSRS